MRVLFIYVRWLYLTVTFLASCSTMKQGVQISSAEPGSQISLVDLDNPDSTGEKLGNPAILDTAKMTNKALKITAVGKAPSFWFTPTTNGKRLDIKVKQLFACTANELNKNRPIRFLLKGYQALTAEDFTLAREMAKQAAELDPTLAAPHIIAGLALLRQGRKDEARVSFNKARALDPEDNDILGLLKLLQ